MDILVGFVTPSQPWQCYQADDENEKDEERRETFLDDDKTVQILHWLKEVDHKQAREGRCPVFVHGIYREGWNMLS